MEWKSHQSQGKRWIVEIINVLKVLKLLSCWAWKAHLISCLFLGEKQECQAMNFLLSKF